MIYVNVNNKDDQNLLDFVNWFCSIDQYTICALLGVNNVDLYFDITLFFNVFKNNFQIIFDVYEHVVRNINVTSGCATFNVNYELINSNVTQKIINVVKQ